MDPRDRNAVLKRHEDLVSLRAPEEPDFRDNARLFMPENAATRLDESKRPEHRELYDSTPILALDDMVGGIFGQLTNPANRWIELETDDKDLNQWQPVKSWLYDVSTIKLASLGPAVSAFYEEIAPTFANMGCFGIGTIFQEEDRGRQRIIDRAIPLSETFIDEDAFGDITRFHREFRLSGRQIESWWGAIPGLVADRSYKIIHAVWSNAQARPGRLGPEAMPALSVYVSPDLPALCRVGGYYEFPFHVVRWKKRANTPWPVGPGHAAFADASMLQNMERAHIIAAEFAAQPPRLMHDDAVINAADYVPDALLAGTLTDRGEPLIREMPRSANLQLSMEQSEKRRVAIRQAFYFGMAAIQNRPQMTATEFLGYEEERLKLMGPHLIRIQRMLSGLIARRYGILLRAGQLPPPPPELRGRRLTIVYQSPLARAMRAAEARATLNIVNTAMNWAAARPDVLDNINLDTAIAIISDGLGAPPPILRDPREVESMRAAQAGQQQQSIALEQAGQAVSIAAEAAHAQQAGTLAQTRNRA